MKHILIIGLLFISIVAFTQTIRTNACATIDNNNLSEITYRIDNFRITNSVIEWTDYQTSRIYIYNIEFKSYYNQKWYIHCLTEGKKILFVVSFIDEIVYTNGLLFYKTIRT